MTINTVAIDPTELSYLIFLHSPRGAGPCSECGAPVEVSQMEHGVVTYNCGAVSPIGGDDATVSHWRRSQQFIAYHGDDRIVAALIELRELRAAAGEDMTVPVGACYFRWGHGKFRCWRYVQHVGAGQWEERMDNDFVHDPSHAELRDN